MSLKISRKLRSFRIERGSCFCGAVPSFFWRACGFTYKKSIKLISAGWLDFILLWEYTSEKKLFCFAGEVMGYEDYLSWLEGYY